ncbi:isopenicillin N synthase family oxygenase [Streptomyces sp. NBC_00083]|uniref:isopenicillin N synthase family dioxygenase n=1 Tax=Streptomyces sp. NBC_00083 TaxID=2975647 RepID=UPI00225B40B9|nr:2-oxoglutarate and iron-dependent oxygenase domain-containing protein [Streptomyces sp. NBC_00083]MCX5387442.1 isopenicillin N synthase family oxygenase [Streptomyces sp. NBC_00083]
MTTAAPLTAEDAAVIIDLAPWRDGGPDGRNEVARRLDSAFVSNGFCLITGHGVPTDVLAELRLLAREFFALPEQVKGGYRAASGGSGWSAGLAIARGGPTDLKEAFTFRAGGSTGSPELDQRRSQRWPAEVPRLAEAADAYLRAMRRLSDELLELCAHALGARVDHFTSLRRDPTQVGALKWYPSLRHLGTAAADRPRLGEHSDFGALTVLDRERGLGGLQLRTAEGGWADAPFVSGSLAVNVGELLARWTGDRWVACRHRVAPPPAAAPDEDLVSLLYVSGADHDALIEAFPPPIGRTVHPPVRWGDWLREYLTTPR